MPNPTGEKIEADVVSIVTALYEWKKRYNRPGVEWTVGTTDDLNEILDSTAQPFFAMGLGWTRGAPKKAVQEIVKCRGMVFEGTTREDGEEIYVYVREAGVLQLT